MSIFKSLIITGLISIVSAHTDYDHRGQIPLSGPAEMPVIYNRPVLEVDGYVPSFSGISTFAHLPYLQCWDKNIDEDYDIAIIGAPYDIGVTFRTGARFGPSGIREGSKRIKVKMGNDTYIILKLFIRDIIMNWV
jgi:agmatinase